MSSKGEAIRALRLSKDYVELQKYNRKGEKDSHITDIYFMGSGLITDNWGIIIDGPKNTPYKNGRWLLKFSFPLQYPTIGPTIEFKNQIHHCDVRDDGTVSLDRIIKSDWVPSFTVLKMVLLVINFLETNNEFDKDQNTNTIKEWVKLYASLSNEEFVKRYDLKTLCYSK